MKFISQLLLAVVMSAPLFAQAAKTDEHKKMAIAILDQYAKAKFITAEIDKVDEKLTLGTKALNKGTIHYSQGKFHADMQGEKRTELFYRGNKLTLVDYPDQDFDKDGARKVTHVQNNPPAFLKSLINLFSSSKNFFKEFKIVGSSLKDNKLSLDLQPSLKELKTFKLNIDTKSKSVESLSFTDDVETQTTIVFNKIDLKKSIPKSAFEFKAKKTDQEVTQ